MADYIIDISLLQGKKSELDSLKANVNSIYSSFTSSVLNRLSGTDISSLSSMINSGMERLKKGYDNSSMWLNNYVSEFQTLENSLANFSGSSINKPVVFSGRFIDIFSKVTIPMIKTQEQITPDASTSTGPVTLTGNTNKDKIFSYLRSQGFNNAAICGILSNIQHESNFNPNSLGDKGTSYGICQWHNSRWTRLKNYCSKNNLSYKSLEGQVSFLVYELKKYYPKVYNTIKNVPNTKKGAYDAAYSWTVHYEVPVNRYKQGDRRGRSASSTYWDAYGNIV